MTLSKKNAARVDTMVQRLQRCEPRMAFPLGHGHHYMRGWSYPWITFRMIDGYERPFVDETNEALLRMHLADAFEAGGRPELVDVGPEMLARVERIESALAELHRRYRSGEIAYKLFSGARLELCVDEVGYGVDARKDTAGQWRIHQLIKHRGNAVDMGLARDLHGGDGERCLRAVPDGLLEAVRARLAADGDVAQVLTLVKSGRMSIRGMGPTSDTGWQITYRDGRFMQLFYADRDERACTEEHVMAIIGERRYLTLEPAD